MVNALFMSCVTTMLVILEAHDEVIHARRVDGIETRRRFVVEHDLRADGNGPGEGDALLHSTRQICWPHLLDPRQTDQLEGPGDAFFDLRSRHAVTEVFFESVGDVRPHVLRIEERPTLEEHRDAPAEQRELLGVHRGDFLSVEDDGPSVRLQEPDEHLEHDALADAGPADDGERLAALHVEIQVLIDHLGTEGLPHAAEPNQHVVGHLAGRLYPETRSLRPRTHPAAVDAHPARLSAAATRIPLDRASGLHFATSRLDLSSLGRTDRDRRGGQEPREKPANPAPAALLVA